MSLDLVPSGKSLPDDIYVVIEIPMNSGIKYEIDKDSNTLFVDRLVSTAMYTPATMVTFLIPCAMTAMRLTCWYCSRNLYKRAQ